MRILLTIFITVLSATLFAQGWMPQGARNSAMANNGVSFIDVFAFHHNPGALGFLTEGTVGASYEARYAMKELQSQSIAVAFPLKVGVISAGGQFYGYDAYRTTRAGVGYSMRLAENISAGIQVNYLGMNFGSTYYGRKHGISAELGALAKLNEKINIGFSVVNLGRAKLSDFQDERYGTTLRLGASYQLIDELMVTAEVEQEISHQTRLRLGLEYRPIDILYIRAGVQGAPLDFAFGFGLAFNRFKIDLATQYNQVLGWSPGLSFLVNFYQPKAKERD